MTHARIILAVFACLFVVEFYPSDAQAKTRRNVPGASKRVVLHETAPVALGLIPAQVLIDHARLYLGQNPTGMARAWCGRFWRFVLARAGYRDPGQKFDVAASWKTLGRPANAEPGAFVVWPHHVGIIVRVTAPGRAVVISGNTGPAGARRVLEEERSLQGAIGFRYI